MARWLIAAVAGGFIVVAAWNLLAREEVPVAASTPRHQSADLRRPIAAVWMDGGQRLAVANSRSGSLSLVDISKSAVVCEVPVGQELAGLARLPGTSTLLTLDAQKHLLLVVSVEGEQFTRIGKSKTSDWPTALAVSTDGKRAAVSSKWSRKIDLFDLSALQQSAADGTLEAVRSIDVPFAPRELLWQPGTGRLVIADAFGGHLAVVDSESGRLLARRTMGIHNIRRMALSPDGKQLYLAHQILDENSPINWQTVHGGGLMNNVVSRVEVQRLVEGKDDLEDDRETIPVGVNGHGAGDPTDVRIDADGALTICAGGSSELIAINRFGVLSVRVDVGQRPIQSLPVPGAKAITVNTMSDSLSLVDLEAGRLVGIIPLGPMRELRPADRGEILFHNSHLSHQGWISCQSCHTDGYTNGMLADTFGDGNWGAPKRILPLGGVAFTDRWAWNGQMEELYDQVRKSLLTTMLADLVEDENVNDLVDYLQTLIPPPPAQPPSDDAADREQIARGKKVFLNQLCNQCHVPPLTYSSSDSYDVGLEDENGRMKFNPPSLRGVGHQGQFFHDGRAKSLESVFRDYAHPGGTKLSDNELADLVRFLRSL